MAGPARDGLRIVITAEHNETDTRPLDAILDILASAMQRAGYRGVLVKYQTKGASTPVRQHPDPDVPAPKAKAMTPKPPAPKAKAKAKPKAKISEAESARLKRNAQARARRAAKKK